MDKVYLKNYSVVAKHGYYKKEHSKPQRFVVSVAATCNVRTAGMTDDLKQTLNYEHIRTYIYDVLMQSPHDLIESLAEEIAKKVLEHGQVSAVEVDIQKPDVWNDSVPGASIVRNRNT